MSSVLRDVASARRTRLLKPWLRRLATLSVLVLVVVALTPPSGQAFPPTAATIATANRAALAQAETVEPKLDPRDLPEDRFHSIPLRRVHRVTAYCDLGLTAAGVPSGVGQCAAPGDIPFGSVVYIPSLDRSFVVTDRTARRFRHNTVDLFMPGRQDCLNFGLNYLECEIYLPRTEPEYGSTEISEAIGSFAS